MPKKTKTEKWYDSVWQVYSRSPGISLPAMDALKDTLAAGDDEDVEYEIYSADDNIIRLCGAIVTDSRAEDERKFFGVTRGYVSPSMLRDAVAQAGEGYTLEINSPGGSVYSGAEMYAILTQKKPAKACVLGIAASMAAILILVAPDRYAATELSSLMYHAPWGIHIGNAAELEKEAARMRGIEKQFAAAVRAAVPGAAAELIEQAFAEGDDLTISAQDAVDLGILRSIDAAPASPEPEDRALTRKAVALMQQTCINATLDAYRRDAA